MAGKGGGAWKVAYADFVTAMMAFFMVMWLTSQNNAVKESVSQYFRDPLGTATEARATSVHGIPGASSSDAALEGEQAGPLGSRKSGIGGTESTAEAAEDVSPLRLHIFERLDRTRDIGTMVVFAANSAELTDQARTQLSALIPDLLGKPNKVEIRGHAARGMLPAGSSRKDHWELCYARSAATMDFLVAHGIEPERIRLSQDAAYEPYTHNRNEAEDPRNNRVEVFAIDELAHSYKETIDRRAGDFIPAPKQPAAPAVNEQHQAHGGHQTTASGPDKPDNGHGKSSAAPHGGSSAAKAQGHGGKSTGHSSPKTGHGKH
uniref:OmpA-like domain-containing protein n=1 Tax=Schlesneria paludicola TaxID=360056 RepID=A0A7C2NVX0_9PLAN